MRKRGRSGGLRRELGPLAATLFTAGMMVGIGIFAALGAATEAAGSGILVAMLLGGTVALATGIASYRQMSGMLLRASPHRRRSSG